MKSFLVTIVCLILIQNNLFSQESGKVRFFTIPENAKVKVDGVPLEKPFVYQTFTTGKHLVEICPDDDRMIVFKDTFEVFKDSLLTYRKRLPTSAKYVSFLNELSVHRQTKVNEWLQKASILTVNASLTAAFIGIYPKDAKKHKERAENARQLYNNSITQEDMDHALALFESNRQNYYDEIDKQKKAISWMLPTLLASYGLSAFYWSKINKSGKKPKFKESPVLCRMQFDFSIDPYDLKTPVFYYALKF